MRIGKYEIGHHSEETWCTKCGAVLTVGDTVYHYGTDEYDSVACSAAHVAALVASDRNAGPDGEPNYR